MDALAPQRQDLSELASDPAIPYDRYWQLTSENLARQAESDEVKTVERSIAVAKQLLANKNLVQRSNPTMLTETSKGDARVRAIEGYRSIGALSTEHRIGEIAASIAVAYVGHHTHARQVELAATRLAQSDIDDTIWGISRSMTEKKGLTFRNFMSSMLYETGVYLSTTEGPNHDHQIGTDLLEKSHRLVRNVGVHELEDNRLAVNEMLKRDHDIKFWRLHERARNEGNTALIREEFRRQQQGFIMRYKEVIQDPRTLAGFGFEWMILLAYRDYIYRHDLIDRAYIRSALPREDYPSDGLTGGQLDNKHSSDAVLWLNGHVQHIQCKVGREVNNKKTKRESMYADQYALPIQVIRAVEAVSDYEADNDSERYFKRKFSEQANLFHNRYEKPAPPPEYEQLASDYQRLFARHNLAA